METKARLFVYDRKEMWVLMSLGAIVAIFAFTLGVHMGKRVATPANPLNEVHQAGPESGGAHTLGQDAKPVPTAPDLVPNRQELTEQGLGVNQAAEDSLSQALHGEVVKTGIKLDRNLPVDLPSQTKAETKSQPKPEASVAATDHTVQNVAEAEGVLPSPATPEAHKAEAKKHVSFTIQVGSHSTEDEAKAQMDEINIHGVKATMKVVDLKAKGKWFRVYVGEYSSQLKADEMGASLKKQKIIESYIVSKDTGSKETTNSH